MARCSPMIWQCFDTMIVASFPSLFRKTLMSTFLLRFKANYFKKMHGYPYSSLRIPTVLAKIQYFFHMVLISCKNLCIQWALFLICIIITVHTFKRQQKKYITFSRVNRDTRSVRMQKKCYNMKINSVQCQTEALCVEWREKDQ